MNKFNRNVICIQTIPKTKSNSMFNLIPRLQVNNNNNNNNSNKTHIYEKIWVKLGKYVRMYPKPKF